MSDRLPDGVIHHSATHLPISWYFDPAIFAAEQKALFQRGPGYVGHELMVPEQGDYLTLAWREHDHVLMRGTHGVNLLSNVCRHRQALLLEGKGRCQNIVCPAHRWTYDLDGGLLGAPEFPTNPPLPLARRPLQNWHGLLFSGERNVTADLADFRLAHEYDFHGYVHDHTQIDECPFNWKTFLDIYLELYHVEFFHPGLKHFVDSGNYEWGFGERWSYQILGLKDQLRQQHSAKYERYRDLLLAHSGGELPKYGTLWSIYYPNVMLEWYPFALVVSTLVPRTPEHTTNVVEFYYPEEVALFERELVEAHQAAYAESAAEDLRLCTLLQRGRMALYRNGAEDRGPYHSPHEDGMVHFHDFVRRELGF